MRIPIIMTPGPTSVSENVRLKRAEKTTNPDLDINFYDFYKETTEKIGEFLKTKNQVRILSGEGILGLEAACASLTEKDDRVLVIENGIFGEGFADFVKMYGGNPFFFRGNRKCKISTEELGRFLDIDSNFKYATIVHCDTPSGMLNDIGDICGLLKSKGIMTVVDSVSAMGGEELKVDEWNIDIVIGASQKCISAPPGLTIVSISEDAFNAMKNRKTPIAAFYCNLLAWEDYYEKKWFPYTPPISDILALRKAIENILKDKDMIVRHDKIASATRAAVVLGGLDIYIEDGFSNTVTVIKVPHGMNDEKILNYMKENYNVMIAGAFGYLKGKVLRIGHMGENARIDKVSYTLFALQRTLEHYGFEFKHDMTKVFLEKF